MKPLSVSLDASAVPLQPAGAGRYIVELTSALRSVAELDLSVVTRTGDQERWETINSAATIIGAVPNARPLRLAYEQIALGRRIAKLGVSVHHGPHYTVPRNCPVPSVVTIHDMTFFDRPEVHEATKVKFFQSAIRYAANHASVIVCVSQRTADRFVDRFSTDVPVVVAPHGIDHERFRPETDDEGDRATRERLGLSHAGQQIVHIGTLEPRKGIESLLRAFEVLAESLPESELVFAGQRGWGLEAFDRAIANSLVKDRITLLGYVNDEDLPAIIRSASVLAYPSVDEGFGLPALEGLACGVPVVTTQGSVMEELCGPAAWLVAPEDHDDLARGLSRALKQSDEERRSRRLEGIERASHFTWARAAELHMEAYELAAQRHAR